jgi:hypothetical protein
MSDENLNYFNYLVLTLFDSNDPNLLENDYDEKKSEFYYNQIYNEKKDLSRDIVMFTIRSFLPLIPGYIFSDYDISFQFEIDNQTKSYCKHFLMDVELIKVVDSRIDQYVFDVIKKFIELKKENKITYNEIDPLIKYSWIEKSMNNAKEFLKKNMDSRNENIKKSCI